MSWDNLRARIPGVLEMVDDPDMNISFQTTQCQMASNTWLSEHATLSTTSIMNSCYVPKRSFCPVNEFSQAYVKDRSVQCL